jgi:hypothetical protein
MHVLELPQEILAYSFECGVHDVGISFLYPLCLTCKSWREIVQDTPQLWGIFNLSNKTSKARLRHIPDQIARAKATSLWLSVDTRFQLHLNANVSIVEKLLLLASNWVYADIPASLLDKVEWNDLSLLEAFVVRGAWLPTYTISPNLVISKDLESRSRFSSSRLRSFSCIGDLPHSLTQKFVSPTLTFLELSNCERKLREILDALSVTRNLAILHLSGIRCKDVLYRSEPIVSLPSLQTLEVVNFRAFNSVLEHLCCKSLEYLTIKSSYCHPHWYYGRQNDGIDQTNTFMVQWSGPSFLPQRLHTLEFSNSLQAVHIPHLIRWLGRLTSLVRLVLCDEAIVPASNSSHTENIFLALSTTAETQGWLCPSLMQLSIEADIQVTDLLPIAHNRGGHYDLGCTGTEQPSRLRLIQGPICTSGFSNEIEELGRSVDEVVCDCLGCRLGTTPFSDY